MCLSTVHQREGSMGNRGQKASQSGDADMTTSEAADSQQ
jgi:hypothetical protein